MTLAFTLGETVYLMHDSEQRPWMVHSVMINLDGCVFYKIVHGLEEHWALEGELTTERDEAKKILEN